MKKNERGGKDGRRGKEREDDGFRGDNFKEIPSPVLTVLNTFIVISDLELEQIKFS